MCNHFLKYMVCYKKILVSSNLELDNFLKTTSWPAVSKAFCIIFCCAHPHLQYQYTSSVHSHVFWVTLKNNSVCLRGKLFNRKNTKCLRLLVEDPCYPMIPTGQLPWNRYFSAVRSIATLIKNRMNKNKALFLLLKSPCFNSLYEVFTNLPSVFIMFSPVFQWLSHHFPSFSIIFQHFSIIFQHFSTDFHRKKTPRPSRSAAAQGTSQPRSRRWTKSGHRGAAWKAWRPAIGEFRFFFLGDKEPWMMILSIGIDL